MATFAIDEFVADCRGAVRTEGTSGALAVKEVLERALSQPGAIEDAVGSAHEIPVFTTWHSDDELTILHVVWPPAVDLFAHDHMMWATIGLYGGREDNALFTRRPDGAGLERRRSVTLRGGDTVTLGAETVHAVSNPSTEWTAAIHIYGGDYFGTPRSMWPDPDGAAVAFDVDRLTRTLEDAASRAR